MKRRFRSGLLNTAFVGIFFQISFLAVISSRVAVATETIEANPNVRHNFKHDLEAAKNYRIHEIRGREYYDAGKYELSIVEYNKAIEIIQSMPDEKWTDVSQIEMDRINEESRSSRQQFSRYRLVQIYEKAGRYSKALEQIDWLLTHKPVAHIQKELLVKKIELQKKA